MVRSIAEASWLLSIVVFLCDFARICMADTTAAPDSTTVQVSSSSNLLCGLSKRPLTEDPIRRTCLRQCRVEQDGDRQFIRPSFAEWEIFCRTTSSMEDWDEECEDFICCTFGCEVYGSDRSRCLSLTGTARRDFLLETEARQYNELITEQRRCEIDKCRAYCARQVFDTCREIQFKEECESGQPQLYGCDVDCSSAVTAA
eukprot:CAMPEP_0178422350 /NCGR_PEP_ID=MMETSP0689_2-20121128/27127_1 /TAXON_ID=160604 /ORGANISM="Amphidinium massartii, Strain CS-259" /LENGTH=200 /DNA_ID=CAMNT_0020043909 /DNA_START=43 /DNA_END=642 /DNA_ORIENTATION=-